MSGSYMAEVTDSASLLYIAIQREVVRVASHHPMIAYVPFDVVSLSKTTMSLHPVTLTDQCC